jgi:hypothetical protein
MVRTCHTCMYLSAEQMSSMRKLCARSLLSRLTHHVTRRNKGGQNDKKGMSGRNGDKKATIDGMSVIVTHDVFIKN